MSNTSDQPYNNQRKASHETHEEQLRYSSQFEQQKEDASFDDVTDTTLKRESNVYTESYLSVLDDSNLSDNPCNGLEIQQVTCQKQNNINIIKTFLCMFCGKLPYPDEAVICIKCNKLICNHSSCTLKQYCIDCTNDSENIKDSYLAQKDLDNQIIVNQLRNIPVKCQQCNDKILFYLQKKHINIQHSSTSNQCANPFCNGEVDHSNKTCGSEKCELNEMFIQHCNLKIDNQNHYQCLKFNNNVIEQLERMIMEQDADIDRRHTEIRQLKDKNEGYKYAFKRVLSTDQDLNKMCLK